MIVYECDSCKKIQRPSLDDTRPHKWQEVHLIGIVSVPITFTLCPECAARPMQFGRLILDNGNPVTST